MNSAIIKSFRKPIVFSLRENLFWKGDVSPSEHIFKNEKDEINSVSLSDIYSLQIIPEYIRSNKSSFYSYELIIVLKNQKRVLVIDHGNLNSLRDDADKIGKFLNVPIWYSTIQSE